MGNGLGVLAAKEADFMIHSLVKFHLFGQELYLTTTHVSLFIICIGLIIFGFVARAKLKVVDGKPGKFQNVVVWYSAVWVRMEYRTETISERYLFSFWLVIFQVCWDFVLRQPTTV